MKKIVFLDRDTFPKRLRLKKPDFKHSWKNYSTTNKKIIRRINKILPAICYKLKTYVL
jgi:hypothetical protein